MVVCKLMCKEVCDMATNLAIDPQLLKDALAVSGVRTKKEAVTMALREFIARRAQAKVVDAFGTLDWDDSYDYKEDRRSRDRKLTGGD
jgi:Arc/MetJ family transcription regulator